MDLWVEVADVAPRLGVSNAGTTAIATIEKGIYASQTWVESVLDSKVQGGTNSDSFDLASCTSWNGFFALKCTNRFLTLVSASITDTVEDYLSDATGTQVVISHAKQVSFKGGYVLIPDTYKGVITLNYAHGFDAVESIPLDIKEAVIAYLPTVLGFSQITNTDSADYAKVINTARRHALDSLRPYLVAKHPKSNGSLTGALS